MLRNTCNGCWRVTCGLLLLVFHWRMLAVIGNTSEMKEAAALPMAKMKIARTNLVIVTTGLRRTSEITIQSQREGEEADHSLWLLTFVHLLCQLHHFEISWLPLHRSTGSDKQVSCAQYCFETGLGIEAEIVQWQWESEASPIR